MTYLAYPPPFPCVHLGINPCLLIWTGETFLWCMGQKFRELWVTIENANTLDYVAMIKFISLTVKCNLLSNKLWKSIWKLPINYLVELVGT